MSWRVLNVTNVSVELRFPESGRRERGVVSGVFAVGHCFILALTELEFFLPGSASWTPFEDHGFRKIEWPAYRIASKRPKVVLRPRWDEQLPIFTVEVP